MLPKCLGEIWLVDTIKSYMFTMITMATVQDEGGLIPSSKKPGVD